MGAQADRYKLRDGMVYYRGSICPTPRLTLGEVIAREPHDTLSARQSEALHEHEGQWMVDFVYRRVSRLPVVSKCMIKCWDSSFHCVV